MTQSRGAVRPSQEEALWQPCPTAGNSSGAGAWSSVLRCRLCRSRPDFTLLVRSLTVSSRSLLMSVAASWYREYLAGTGHALPRGPSAVSTDPRSTIEDDLEMWQPVLERFHLAHAESHSPGATHAPQRSGGRDDRTILCL